MYAMNKLVDFLCVHVPRVCVRKVPGARSSSTWDSSSVSVLPQMNESRSYYKRYLIYLYWMFLELFIIASREYSDRLLYNATITSCACQTE